MHTYIHNSIRTQGQKTITNLKWCKNIGAFVHLYIHKTKSVSKSISASNIYMHTHAQAQKSVTEAEPFKTKRGPIYIHTYVYAYMYKYTYFCIHAYAHEQVQKRVTHPHPRDNSLRTCAYRIATWSQFAIHRVARMWFSVSCCRSVVAVALDDVLLTQLTENL